MLEELVAERSVRQLQLVGDDEAGVDLAVLDPCQQRPQIAVHVALPGADGEALVHERAHRELVHEPAVDADDGDDPAGAAAHDRLAEREGTLGLAPHRLLHAVVRVQRSVVVRLHPDGVDARIRAAAAGQLLQDLRNAVDLLVVQRLDAGVRARDLEALVEPVDDDDALGAEQLRARGCELSDRAGAPDRDDLAAGDVAHLSARVAGREDVRQEQDALVGDASPRPAPARGRPALPRS